MVLKTGIKTNIHHKAQMNHRKKPADGSQNTCRYDIMVTGFSTKALPWVSSLMVMTINETEK